LNSIGKSGQAVTATANDLLSCDLFFGLDPERLMIAAESMKVIPISSDLLRQPLTDLADKIHFVIEGEFQVVPYSVQAGAYSNATGTTLKAGDWWGKIWSQPNVDHRSDLAVMAIGPGRLGVMYASRMRRFLSDWPEVAQAALKMLSNRQLEMQFEMFQQQVKIADTDRILKKIEDVTKLLMQGGVGGQKLNETLQRKFRLSSVPNLNSSQVEIEQFYIKTDVEISEDRVRSVSNGSTTTNIRTQRIEADGLRREFKSEIGWDEYLTLKLRKSGELIKKTRYKLKDSAGAEAIVIDEFQEPISDLIVMEADFLSAEDAATWEPPSELQSGVVEEVSDRAEFSNKNIAGAES